MAFRALRLILVGTSPARETSGQTGLPPNLRAEKNFESPNTQFSGLDTILLPIVAAAYSMHKSIRVYAVSIRKHEKRIQTELQTKTKATNKTKTPFL